MGGIALALAFGLSAAFAVGALVGIALTAICRQLGLGGRRTAIAATAGAVLAALVAGDASVPGAGRWWAERPNMAAATTGLLLLALTVLVVEAALTRFVAAAEARRWRPAAVVAVGAVMDVVEGARQGDDSLKEAWLFVTEACSRLKRPGALNRRTSWERTMLSDAVMPLYADMLRTARNIGDRTDSVLLSTAPVLTATDQLHEVYDAALDVLAGFRRLEDTLVQSLEVLRQALNSPEDDSPVPVEPATVTEAFEEVMACMRRFEDLAAEVTGGTWPGRWTWRRRAEDNADSARPAWEQIINKRRVSRPDYPPPPWG